MELDAEKQLFSKYPELFANVGQPMSCMNFGIECGSGWSRIIHSACECLEDTGVRFDQIKEKFGLLRIYYTAKKDTDGFVSGVIRMAESISGKTCEQCGNPGSIRGGGWLVCLCDSCDLKRGGSA